MATGVHRAGDGVHPDFIDFKVQDRAVSEYWRQRNIVMRDRLVTREVRDQQRQVRSVQAHG